MRKVIAVVAGVILANLAIFGWEVLIPLLPFGRAIDPSRAAEPGFLDSMPLAAKLWVAAGWTLGAGIGALLAFRVARSDWTGWVVAGFVAAAGIVNGVLIQHPLWMQLWTVAGPFVGALMAFGGYRRLRAVDLHLDGAAHRRN